MLEAHYVGMWECCCGVVSLLFCLRLLGYAIWWCPCSLLSLQFVVLFLPINFCLQDLPQDIPINPDKFHRLSVPILNLHGFYMSIQFFPQVFYHLQYITYHHMSFSRGFARRFAPISPVWRPCRGVAADTELPPGARRRASGGCGLGLVDWNGTIGYTSIDYGYYGIIWYMEYTTKYQ